MLAHHRAYIDTNSHMSPQVDLTKMWFSLPKHGSLIFTWPEFRDQRTLCSIESQQNEYVHLDIADGRLCDCDI